MRQWQGTAKCKNHHAWGVIIEEVSFIYNIETGRPIYRVENSVCPECGETWIKVVDHHGTLDPIHQP